MSYSVFPCHIVSVTIVSVAPRDLLRWLELPEARAELQARQGLLDVLHLVGHGKQVSIVVVSVAIVSIAGQGLLDVLHLGSVWPW